MKEISEVKEIQEIALNILVYIDKICKENKLNYFLSDGTLLGAVRHGGYIPWDDDVDIWMSREDYLKFMEIVNKQDSHFKVIDRTNTKDYIYGFGKVIDTRTLLLEKAHKKCKMGIYVDIFTYSGVPGNEPKDYKNYVKWCVFLNKQRYPAFRTYKEVCKGHKDGNVRRFFTWSIRKIVGGKNILRMMDYFGFKYSPENTKYVSCLTSGYKEKDIMPKEIIEETVDIEFEGRIFKAPVGYKKYLEIEYGDYMTLPPEEQRVSHHNFKAWWL